MGVTKSAPVASAVAGFAGLKSFAEDTATPLRDATSDPVGREMKAVASERLDRLLAKARARRLHNAMRRNEAALATMHPDIYAMLVAGERLPIGGRMFGGLPNRELVANVTARMATGEFVERDPLDELRALIGRGGQ